MRKLKLFVVGIGLAGMAGFGISYLGASEAKAQGACSRVDYYDGCGKLYHSSGNWNCSNVIVVYMDWECDT